MRFCFLFTYRTAKRLLFCVFGRLLLSRHLTSRAKKKKKIRFICWKNKSNELYDQSYLALNSYFISLTCGRTVIIHFISKDIVNKTTNIGERNAAETSAVVQ